MSLPLKSIYRFNVLSVKIPASFSHSLHPIGQQTLSGIPFKMYPESIYSRLNNVSLPPQKKNKDVHILISRTCEDVILNRNGTLKLCLKMRRLSQIIWVDPIESQEGGRRTRDQRERTGDEGENGSRGRKGYVIRSHEPRYEVRLQKMQYAR